MRNSEHLAIGFGFSYGLLYLAKKVGLNIDSATALLLIGGSLLGSVLPDIDHEEGLLGRFIPFLSEFLKEKSITHSIVFALIVPLSLSFIEIPLGIGAFIGILSHISFDIMTPNDTGVGLLYPFKKKKYFKNTVS
ncbi:conserved hypothetical protein [Lachnospiraceae bacterium KM106-2]|nr:conserved hypothetical protein [Lachnospiraceae bacterium KM106-2]